MKSNTRFKTTLKGIECLNCKQPISNKDNFCSNCGQVNDLKPLSIKQYLSELLAGLFSFDTRTLTTLYQLVFKPGKVTKNYISGKRMCYVNPFKMYLHISILFFLMIGIINFLDDYKEKESFNNIASINVTSKPKLKDSISTKEILKLVDIKVDSLLLETKFIEKLQDTTLTKRIKEKQLRNIIFNYNSDLHNDLIKKYTFKNDSLKKLAVFKKIFIKQIRKKLTKKGITYKFSDSFERPTRELIIEDVFGKKNESKIKIFNKSKTKNALKALDSLGIKHTKWNVFLYKKVKDYHKIIDDEEYRITYLRNGVSKIFIILFFILPLFTIVLKILYFRKKRTYTEHLIFVFNVQTVFFIFIIFAIILKLVIDFDFISLFTLAVFPIYLFIALKKFYQQGFFKTILKFFILNIVFFVLSTIGVLTAFLVAFAF